MVVLVVLAVQVLVTIKVNLMVLQGQAVLVAVIMLEMAARVAQLVMVVQQVLIDLLAELLASTCPFLSQRCLTCSVV